MGAQAFDRVLPRGVLDITSAVTGIINTPLIPPPSPKPTTSSSKVTPGSNTISSTSSLSVSSSTSVSSSVVSPTLSSTSTTTEASSSSLTPTPVTRTVTYVESSSIASPVANAGSNTSFLQNKLASGFVFAIAAIFGLVFIIFIATFFIRRRRQKRLNEEAVSFDPVTFGYDDLEKTKQNSSLGHGSHETKGPPVYNHYSPPLLQYGSSPPAGYTPHTAAQLYVPPARYGSPPLSPQQQHQHHLSYISAMSSAEDANYSRHTSVGPVGGQVPEDIRRQYST